MSQTEPVGAVEKTRAGVEDCSPQFRGLSIPIPYPGTKTPEESRTDNTL